MKISKTIKDLTNRANQLAFPDQTQEDRYFNYISISIAVDQTFDTFQGFFDVWHSDNGYNGYQSSGTFLSEMVEGETMIEVLNKLDAVLTAAEDDVDPDSDYSIDVETLSTSTIFVGNREYKLVD